MKFVYDTGLRLKIFSNARLRGTWDAHARHASEWTERPMRESVAEDGAVIFEADVEFSAEDVGKEFSWRVTLDGPLGLNREGIVTEPHGLGHDALYRTFALPENTNGEQRYYLTHVRRLGARAVRQPGSDERGLRFSVWSPNAEAVDVVFGMPTTGYIADDGSGIDPSKPVIALT